MGLSGKYKIKEPVGNIETHEVFLDTLAHVKEEEFGVSEKKFEVKIKEKVIYAIFGLFFLLTTVIFSKTFYLQIIQGKELNAISESNKARISSIRPERGIIYDSNLKKLVLNSPAFDLVCDKRNYLLSKEKYLDEINTIAKILKVNPLDLEEKIATSEDLQVQISENIGHETLLVLETKMNELPDCQIEKNTVRNYAMGHIFSHVLGYLGKINRNELKNTTGYTSNDYIGKMGLEKSYEEALRGIPGSIQVIRDVTGIKRGTTVLYPPNEGHNLVLNIDAGLQEKTYDSLEKSIKNVGAKKGAAVALDPRTGAVLAMVSYPAFDNNIFSQGISQADFNKLQNDSAQPFFNRVIAAQYPTGSTIKPFLACAALQENIISPNKIINDSGYILVQSQNDPSVNYRFGGVVPHGDVNMRKALAVSSNIYFYTVGGGYENQQGLGPNRIKKYLNLFGWEEKTGIDIPGEYSGFVPSPEWKKEKKNEQWWDGDTYNLSIGQSDLKVTPLQVAYAYSSIANGGTLYQPQIVKKVIEGSGGDAKNIKEFTPQIVRSNFISPENLEVIREGMRDGVQKEYGSSHMLNTLPFSVAGKTGTAETGKTGYYNTWSSNFAPYDNPQIVFVVTIEGVQGLRAASLPVANEVLYWYFTHE